MVTGLAGCDCPAAIKIGSTSCVSFLYLAHLYAGNENAIRSKSGFFRGLSAYRNLHRGSGGAVLRGFFFFGRQCYYFDVQSCRQAAGTSGICTANQAEAGDFNPGAALQEGINAQQSVTDNARKTAAYNALINTYGPIAGDPDSALKLQEYGQRERTNPIAVEQGQADLLAQKLQTRTLKRSWKIRNMSPERRQ